MDSWIRVTISGIPRPGSPGAVNIDHPSLDQVCCDNDAKGWRIIARVQCKAHYSPDTVEVADLKLLKLWTLSLNFSNSLDPNFNTYFEFQILCFPLSHCLFRERRKVEQGFIWAPTDLLHGAVTASHSEIHQQYQRSRATGILLKLQIDFCCMFCV